MDSSLALSAPLNDLHWQHKQSPKACGGQVDLRVSSTLNTWALQHKNWLAKSALGGVDRTQNVIFSVATNSLYKEGKRVNFLFSKESKKTKRVLFTKEWISISARKNGAIRLPSYISSTSLWNKCSVILQAAPRLQGKLDLRTVFQPEKEFLSVI